MSQVCNVMIYSVSTLLHERMWHLTCSAHSGTWSLQRSLNHGSALWWIASFHRVNIDCSSYVGFQV